MNKNKYALSGVFLIALALICVFSTCDMGYEKNMLVFTDNTVLPLIVTHPKGMNVRVGQEAELRVEGALPDGAEGNLLYQWFQYLTPRAYEEQGGAPLPGATDATFKAPTDVDGEFFYYAVVTYENTKVNGRRTTSVKSEPATVTVNDPKNAPFPFITKQPEAGKPLEWSPDIELPTLEVVVAEFTPIPPSTEIPSDEVRYQWYVTDTMTNIRGTLIPGATSPAIIPPIALPGQETTMALINGPGDYYYFVIITNFYFNAPGRRESTVASVPVRITIKGSEKAEAPVIREQPVSAISFIGEAVKPLTVQSPDPDDNGDLSYQWYTAADITSNTGGTLIEGAVSASFPPPIDNTRVGQYSYYVVVTNNNPFASEQTTASVTSKVATIAVASPASRQTNATFTVQFGGANQHQYVRGFGGMDVAWGNFPSYTPEDYENMYNPDKYGYNMLRIMILPHNVDINKTLQRLISNDIYTTQERSRFFENVKTVNRYGGYVLASPWSPPAAWKTNNSINGGGSLRVSDYQNYANYLRSFAQIMLNNGAPVYAIGIQNEPNYVAGYDGCEWTSDEMRNFFRQVGRFTEGVAGFGGGKVIPSVKTMNGESANTTTIHRSAMNNAAAREAIDILGRHNYGSRNDNAAGTGATATDNWIYRATEPKEMWMTEHNLNSNSGISYPNDHTWNYVWVFMNDVDMTVRINHEAAFIWWSAKRFYSMVGDGTYGTIGGPALTATGELLPRGWGLAHYAKFAKESYRVGVAYSGTTAGGAALAEGTNINGSTYANFESTTAKVSAFMKIKGGEIFQVNWRDQNVPISDIEEITMVMFTPTNYTGGDGVNLGNVRLQLPSGFRIASAVAMRSDSNIFDSGGTSRGTPRWETVEITQDRNAAIVNLPASTILSVRFTQ